MQKQTVTSFDLIGHLSTHPTLCPKQEVYLRLSLAINGTTISPPMNFLRYKVEKVSSRTYQVLHQEIVHLK